MPIFEYVCENCRGTFEQLMVGEEDVRCPACSSSKVSKQYSRFGMGATVSKAGYESLPQYSGGGCGCTPGSCGCKN
jgi:putative FmdB family regulatory protein